MKYDFEGTLISTIITKKRIYLMSDGKLTSVSTGESKDNHSKIHPINEKVGILVAGRHIPNLPSYIIQQSNLKNLHSIEEIANITKEGLKHAWENLSSSVSNDELNNVRLFAFVVGFDNKKSPRLFYIDNMTEPRFKINERPLFDAPRDFEVGAMAHGSGDYNNPSKSLVKHVQNYTKNNIGPINLDDLVLEAFNKTKNELASSSPQIGGQTFISTIDR